MKRASKSVRRPLLVPLASWFASAGLHALAFGVSGWFGAGGDSPPALFSAGGDGACRDFNVTIRSRPPGQPDPQPLPAPPLPSSSSTPPASLAAALPAPPLPDVREWIPPPPPGGAGVARIAAAPEPIQTPPLPPVPDPEPATLSGPGDFATETEASPPSYSAPARALENLRLPYPESCRRLGHEGTALIECRLDADGRQVEIRLVRSSGCPDMDEAALAALRSARFAPARERGAPVPSTVTQPVTFKLKPAR